MCEDKKEENGKVLSMEEAREKRQKALQEPMKHPLDAFGDPGSIQGWNDLDDHQKALVQESFVEGNEFMMYTQHRADLIMDIAQKIRNSLEALNEPESGALIAALLVNAVSGFTSLGIKGPVASIIFTSIFSQFSTYLEQNPPPPKPNTN